MKPKRLIYCQSFKCSRKQDCDLFTGHLFKAVQMGTVDLEQGEKLMIEHYLPEFGECKEFVQRIPYDSEARKKV